VPPRLGTEERIRHRRRLVGLGRQYTPVGKLSAIVFEPQGMNAPKRNGDIVNGNFVDWDNLGKANLPWLGVSPDGQDLLIVEPLPPLPDIPDTRTFPPTPTKQLYSDRTQEYWGDFLVIQPVFQIFCYPLGRAEQKIIPVKTGFDGSQMAFLVHRSGCEGHFIGGHFML
jgi:hypothetical protein